MNKKILLIILGVIVLIGLGVFLLGGKEVSNTGSGVTRTTYTNSESPEADRLLAQLKNLKTITLDAAILTSDAFTSLVDYARPLVRPATGRSNPFAPVGAVSAEPQATSTSQ